MQIAPVPRFALLGNIGNLLDLAHNPRMLAFVAALDENRLRAVRSDDGRISPAGLYKEIIDFWLASETARQRRRRGISSIDESERLAACTALAQRLWESKKLTIGLNDLAVEVSATLTGLVERGYSDDEAGHLIGSGSLLVRTEDGTLRCSSVNHGVACRSEPQPETLTMHGPCIFLVADKCPDRWLTSL